MDKFFVVGCPRSGTTMVQQALNRHSRIAIPPETKFFFSFLGHSWRSQQRHIQRLNEDLGIRLPELESPIRSAAEGRAFYELMARQYVERLNKKGKIHFGEKTPEHTGHLPRIRQLFPDAKILILYRDGRDVALSLSKTPWTPGDLFVSFFVWLYYQRLVAQAKNSDWPNLYFARYEDIVADPEKEFSGIVDFLGLPYEKAVAEGFGNREGIPERELGWKASATEKITTERAGAFQRELNASQIGILEHLGKRTLNDFGYPLQSDGNSPLPFGFSIKLACGIAAFMYRLPWHLVVHELASQAISSCSNRAARLLRFVNSLRGTLPGRRRGNESILLHSGIES